ncbi:PEST proteolytic signal containing nuclear protein L homeolog [Xenopus laevis]|uniref:PEST proteolytic signal-containing nuclear protein n=1 Tax=Xenopus laevis TaxID=8355 RepID=Q2TAG0_XENLA|nr:PEST proteolytic signal containing nuclear protein L homeolog [Xenopus laevis]AAI10946.1 Pcnp protein [Xenopus laevis]
MLRTEGKWLRHVCAVASGKMADKKGRLGGGPEEDAEKAVNTKTVSSSNGGENSSRSTEKRAAEDSKNEPCPSKVPKIGFAIGSQRLKKSQPISIKLGASKPKEAAPAIVKKKSAVASVFNDDDDSEPEEMPPEAKMRMKNIGRDTPTSAGPNSFNKGKHGFSDSQKLWERDMKTRLDHKTDE